jgi:hypothetical protein
MNKCSTLMLLITPCFLLSPLLPAQDQLPQARIMNLSVGSKQVLVLHTRPGYVSSVRVLEDVSSAVPGDPGSSKEHSELEPQLVFFKATSAKPAQTNALITTKGGREVSLSMVSEGESDHNGVVDYVLNFGRPRSLLVTAAHSSFVIGETRNVGKSPASRNKDDGRGDATKALHVQASCPFLTPMRPRRRIKPG